MADKPSYKQARSQRKGTSSMEIEGAIDTTKPKTFTDQSLAPPKKPGEPNATISPEPKAGEGWKAQSAIEHPGDVPHRTDLDKT